MRTSGRSRPAERPWVAALLALCFVLGMGALTTAAPPKEKEKPLNVKVAEPRNGSTVSGTIMVSAKVLGTPVSVKYKVDGGPTVHMAESAKKKWSATWNTTGAANGNHSIAVIAADAAGNVAQDSVQVTVNNRALTIDVINPTEGATVTGQVTLQAAVSSSGTVTSVTYAAGSGGTEVPMSFNAALGFWEALWETSQLPPDNVTLYFRAADDIGKTATATRTVTIGSMAPPTGEWTHARGDLQNRAYTAESYGTSFTSLWTAWPAVHSSRLVLYDGILYAASQTSPGQLSALDAATGELLFDLRMESIVSPAAVGPDAAYISVLNTAVLAIRPDGSTLWRSAIQGTSAPLVTPDGILVGDRAGKVYALDPRTGEPLWSVQTSATYGFMTEYMPVYAGGRLYLPGWDSIPVIDVANRQVAFTISHAPWSGLMYDGGLLYVAGMYALMAFDGATGEMRWSFEADTSTPPAAANGIVIVGANGPGLYALNGATGEVVWSQVLVTGTAYGSPVIAGDLVYTGTSFGGVKVFHLTTGEHLATLMPWLEVRNTPVPAGGVLYIPDAQWGVYALKKE